MTFPSQKNCNHLLAGALVVAHLVTCFLAPWFHQHPGQDHVEVNGNFYHSHASEFDQDHHDLQEALHLLEGSQLFEKMQVSIESHFGQIIVLGQYVPQIDFFGSPFGENSPPNFVVKTFLKLPPIQPARDYFDLTATGLSPPLA